MTILHGIHARWVIHEFHENCHSVTFSFHEKKTPNDAVTPQCQSQLTSKMKGNAVPRLLSSLVWIDQYNQCNGMTSFMEFMHSITFKVSPVAYPEWGGVTSILGKILTALGLMRTEKSEIFLEGSLSLPLIKSWKCHCVSPRILG